MRFQVSDMACADCARAIERAVAQAGGKAAADPHSRLVTVDNLREVFAAAHPRARA